MTSGKQRTPIDDFQNSMTSASSLIAMYKELRQFRGLGRRGRLAPGNDDLLWLPRSAIVCAISALDEYIHAVLRLRIPILLQSEDIPDHLCRRMSEVIQIKNGKDFRQSRELLLASDTMSKLIAELDKQKLSTESYQAPDKIELAYKMIGYEHIFSDVAGSWPGPGTTEKNVKDTLVLYVRRRNQIAHEGDREPNGSVRRIQPDYAQKVAKYISDLTRRLDQVVFRANSRNSSVD